MLNLSCTWWLYIRISSHLCLLQNNLIILRDEGTQYKPLWRLHKRVFYLLVFIFIDLEGEQEVLVLERENTDQFLTAEQILPDHTQRKYWTNHHLHNPLTHQFLTQNLLRTGLTECLTRRLPPVTAQVEMTWLSCQPVMSAWCEWLQLILQSSICQHAVVTSTVSCSTSVHVLSQI